MAPTGAGEAVALDGVWRAFGNVQAVADLSFVVPSGTVTVLLGPNGAGKTTVVRLVTGALHTHGGTVHTLGIDPGTEAAGSEVRRRCGVVPARPRSTTASPARTTSATPPTSSRSIPR